MLHSYVDESKGPNYLLVAALIRHHLENDVRRLVLEQEDSFLDFDRRLLSRELVAAGRSDALVFDHARNHQEHLLSMPDAIAWCWGRGGHWRVKAKSVVTDVFDA